MNKCEICGRKAKWLDVRDLSGTKIYHYYCDRHVKRQSNNLAIGIPL